MNQFRPAQSVAALLVAALIPVAVSAERIEPLVVQPHGSARERLLSGGACAGCDLRSAHLEGAHLIGADLRNADLRDANLRSANLEGADLSGARLDGADLRDVQLSNADLSATDLRRADLRGAVVINAYAPDVCTEGMRFAGADLTGSHLIYGGGPD